MDSGNSGSMQSSSGGDEEYDSSTNRPENHHHHALLNPPDNYFLHPSLGSGGSGTHFLNINPVTLSSSSPSNPHLLSHPSLYDPTPSLFLAFSQQTSSSLQNLTSCTDLAANASFSGQAALGLTPLSSDHQTTAATSSHGPSAPPHGPGPTRNPKKRTRASRRAPTTVLTTDTSNFRAMVQEFTGIPAPPFSASPYSRTRLDLFGSSSTGSTIMRSAPSHFEQIGGYNSLLGLNPFRPSPQKFPNNVNPCSANSNSSFNVIDHASSVGFNNQLGSTSDHIPRQQQQPQNLLNMQNQVLSFQSLINPEFPHPLHHHLGDNKSPLASLEELASFGKGLQSYSWRGSSGSMEDHNGSQRGDHRFRTFDGSCKQNYSASDHQHFHHDKGLEGANNNLPTRGEGTLDTWICPAD